MSPRRSGRKKNVTPELVVVSDNDDFQAVVSDDLPDNEELADNEEKSHQNSNRTNNRNKVSGKRGVSGKKRAPVVESDEDEVQQTPPPTPSPVKAAGQKKRVLANTESDEDNVFVPSPTRDSPKKARVKEPSTPSKPSRQNIFDAAVLKARPEVAAGNAKYQSASSPFKTPSRAAPPLPDLDDSTVYQEDLEMRRVVISEVLQRCEIHQPGLVDPTLKSTYKKIPRLQRMADFAPAWGPRCEDGGFQFSEVLQFYPSLDVEYIKRLVAFSHDKAGSVANLSRIDPTLLGVKDSNSFSRNVLYLYGKPSEPLLCFSLILVTSDNRKRGRFLGTDKEWVLKDIAGVLLAMELERFVAVIGLAYQLPYVPDDNTRRETDLLHFAMVENAFSFTTGMMHKNEFEKAKASSSKSTPIHINKNSIYAPASPSLSKVAASSSAARKVSLRASDTVPIYDGREQQLVVPDDLRKIPNILPRYHGDIPELTLALVAYTVSTYSPMSGARRDQLTANLNIHFGVVLHEPVFETGNEASANDEEDSGDEQL